MVEVTESTGGAAEGNGAAKPAKSKTEYTAVKMNDGRVVLFAGNRQADKEVTIDHDTGVVALRIDFRNGETRTISSDELDSKTKLKAVGHGLSQKTGDEYSGVKAVDDMVIAAEEMMDRLRKGDWEVERAAGDSFSGASVVIKAICEVTGKPIEEIKKYLNDKLDAAKAAVAAGNPAAKLSRADLYASFKSPTSKTGVVIERLEREAREKSSKMDANALLAEIGDGAGASASLQ